MPNDAQDHDRGAVDLGARADMSVIFHLLPVAVASAGSVVGVGLGFVGVVVEWSKRAANRAARAAQAAPAR
jgi:hypothetical protein